MKNQEIIEEMTLFEKASMMSGRSVWETMDFKHLGIPSLFLSDGPHGIRKQLGSADHLGLNKSIQATCFPTAATIANSWDENLATQIGQALGKEAKELGVNVILGPGLNIKRNPLCGRNFEYFSEDPFLTSRMAVNYIKGIQSEGVAATPKHYAVNSQELRRMSNDSVIDERTLREIYLPGFEASVKEGEADFIMTSYNRVNGEYANENQHLLNDILYKEWGFNGVVVTDWGGSNNHVLGVERGSHLEMPGTGVAGALEIKQAVEDGHLDESILDQRVDELLTVVFKLANNKSSSDVLSDELVHKHNKLAYEAAIKSAVLLKNDKDLLPISTNQKIAIIGDFAYEPRYQGAGSSSVNPTQLDSVQTVVEKIGSQTIQTFKGFTREDKIDQSLVIESIEGAKNSDVVIIFAGLPEIIESEGVDRSNMFLPKNQNNLINEITKVNSNVVVVLSGGSPVELPWINKVSAVLHTYLAGQANGQATWDLITGKVSPSGKLNETYPIKYEDVPSSNYYPGPEATSEYKESIFVGYRYYSTANIPVQFPFGYGLTYTKFEYSNLTVNRNTIQFEIKNVGSFASEEIAQVYLTKKESAIFRSSKELIGFKKIYLEPSESKVISIEIDERSFSFYNPKKKQWEIEDGLYTVLVGESSEYIHLETDIYKDGIDASYIYDTSILNQYCSADVKKVPDSIFESLIGRPLPDKYWNKNLPLDSNDTLSQMYYAKSWLARKIYYVITYFLNRGIKKGKPNLNLYFNYNMTFRAMAKMTGGWMNKKMVDEIVRIVNGNFWSGSKGLVYSFLENRRITRGEKTHD